MKKYLFLPLFLFFLQGFSTTVKAIIVTGENKSQVSESVITIETLEKKTIAEILAAGAQDKVETSATVQAVYSAGLMLGDATGYITAYLGATPDVAVGDVVDVVGPTSAYGGCIQFGQGTEVTKTGTAEVVYPTAVELDGAAFDALVAEPVIKYVKVKGTLTISGNYKDLEIEGATNVGSIQCTSEVLGTVISGQVVEVTGFFAYKSGSRTIYGNIIATSIREIPTYATIAKVKAAAKADKVGVIYKAHDVLVTYVNSNNVYVYDGTDGLMLYGKNSGFKVGDKISAKVAGELYLYNGLTEISNCTFTDLSVISSDNEVTPQKATIADVTNLYAQFESELVTIEGLTTDVTSWDENRLILFRDDIDNGIVVRDNFKVATKLTFDPEKTYNITGFVAAYTAEGTTSYRIYPRSAADIDNGNPSPEPRKTSKENPYSVTEVLAFEIAAKTDTIQVGAWVEGYIIGTVKNNKLVLGVEETAQLNIAIAATADEQTVFLPVELASKSDAYTALNLVDNPAMLGREVWLCGTITQYFDMNGLKALSDFSLDGHVAPTIKPATGTYYEAQEVTITAGEGYSIFYTLDGSEPTASSKVYTAPFTVETTTTVKAIAVKGENKSRVSKSVITIRPEVDAGVKVNGIYYNLNNKSLTAEVTTRIPPENVYYQNYSGDYTGDIVIPSSINVNGKKYSVTNIGKWAFLKCDNLTSVTIPNSVTNIGYGAFAGCSRLTSVTIPNSVTSIEEGAFGLCYKLTSVTIPNSVTSIGDSVFVECTALTSITISNCVTSISADAFSGCVSLTSINIPNSVTSIGRSAFYNCSGLTSVIIGENVTSIGNYAFSGCRGLTSINIPNSVTCIGSSAFSGCSRLTSINIPNSVTSIGYSAFSGCSRLTSITIPESVATIEYGAFSGCSGLKTIKVSITDNALFLSNGIARQILYNLSNNINIQLIDREGNEIKHFVVPDNVTSINNYAFYNCSGLTCITIGDCVTKIDEYAFSGCSSLTTVRVSITDNALFISHEIAKQIKNSIGENIQLIQLIDREGNEITHFVVPENETSIGDDAFYNCCGLTSVIINDSVTSIGGSAFYGCAGLTSITIPKSVSSIGNKAFSGCTNLTSVTINSKQIGNSRLGILFGQQVKSYVLGEAVTSICDRAFEGCTGLTSIAIGNSVTSIGNSAFSGCSGLTKINLPEGVTSIGEEAFSGCSGLTSITLPEGVTSIDNRVFSGCSALTSVAIPNNVVRVGDYAFSGCRGLTSITMGSGVKSIGEKAFEGCSNLANLIISDMAAWCSVSFNKDYYNKFHIESHPLWNDRTHHIYLDGQEVIDLKIPEGVASIGDYVFYGCQNLKSVSIPESVTSIGEEAFHGCNGLEAVNISNLEAWCRISFSSNPLTYAHRLFVNGKEITNLIIPEGVYAISDIAFSGCSQITSITIPSSVTSIGNGAFSGMAALDHVFCYANNVPSTGADVFKDSNTEYVGTLHVPEASLRDYSITDPWRNFKNIVALTGEELPVSEIRDDLSSTRQFYTLDGKPAGKGQKGVQIVRSGGKSKKVLVK